MKDKFPYVDTAPEEFESGSLTLKRITCFLSTLRQKNIKKTQQSLVILDLRLTKTRANKSHYYPKAPFSKCFPSTLKRKAGVFKYPQFEERFQKAQL